MGQIGGDVYYEHDNVFAFQIDSPATGDVGLRTTPVVAPLVRYTSR